jgi:hypothetical protein
VTPRRSTSATEGDRHERPDPVGEILDSGLDDWVMATEVWDVVTPIYSMDTASTWLFCEGLTSYLFGEALMIPGQVTRLGFEAFAPDVAGNLERLHREWAEVTVMPEFGEVAWFAITPDGEARAKGYPPPQLLPS